MATAVVLPPPPQIMVISTVYSDASLHLSQLSEFHTPCIQRKVNGHFKLLKCPQVKGNSGKHVKYIFELSHVTDKCK